MLGLRIMRVYHFINAEFGLEDIIERRLKISRIMELNDPFEFLGANLSDPNFRKAMKATKATLSKSKGILCFSKNWNNPVQWSHYSDKHKGLCLGFDVPDELLVKVKYVDRRLSHDLVSSETQMLKFLTTKFAHWQYEEEYRVFRPLEEEIDGRYYEVFSDNLILRQVIVGAQSSITRAQISNALGDIESKVEVFKASVSTT